MTQLNSLFKKEKTINALLHIIERMNGKVDMHKAFKTLYFADRYHLSKYGRSITGDDYIAMNYGPVPSKTDDMLKAVRGDSYFSYSQQAIELQKYFHFIDRFTFEGKVACNRDWLSETDFECLDEAILLTKDLSFQQLTTLSHDYAWSQTPKDEKISIGNILRECGNSEEYIDYIIMEQQAEKSFCA